MNRDSLFDISHGGSVRTSVPVLEADVVGEAVLVLVLSVAVRTYSRGDRHVLGN